MEINQRNIRIDSALRTAVKAGTLSSQEYDEVCRLITAAESTPSAPAVDAGARDAHTAFDDKWVDAFAVAMKQKLADARAKGRSGWENCEAGSLSAMLREHVEKGDPRDVANFCMFLWAIRSPIYGARAPEAAAGEPVAFEFQHDETGRTTYVDLWQVKQGFANNNPRWQLIGPVYRHVAPPAAISDVALKRLAQSQYRDGYAQGWHDQKETASGQKLTDADIAALARTVDEFEDCNETSTDHDTIMRFVSLGLLDCDHFTVTAKARALLRASSATASDKEA